MGNSCLKNWSHYRYCKIFLPARHYLFSTTKYLEMTTTEFADHLKQNDEVFRKTFNIVKTKLSSGIFESEQITADAEKQLKIA
jgi:hypothetical protein